MNRARLAEERDESVLEFCKANVARFRHFLQSLAFDTCGVTQFCGTLRTKYDRRQIFVALGLGRIQ